MARSSLLTASVRRNLLRWAQEMDDSLGTTSGHSHDGTDSRTLSATGNTLDQAYDQGGVGAGRAVTVNDGAVTLTKSDAGTENVLELNASPSVGAAGSPLSITCGANCTSAGIVIANSGSSNDVTGTAGWSVTKAGVGTFDSLVVGAVTLAEDTLPAGTSAYIGRDNTGDVTINALTGKAVNIAVAGTDVVAVSGTALTITGNLSVSGTFGISGNWDVAATLTVDELILDTDGAAPAATNCYIVRDNTGDLTLNAVTGKTINLAIAGVDEVTLSATIMDMGDNAIDNVGFLVLNAATAPAGTEVYAVNDNSGDLTLNALNTKSVIVAVAGTDEYTFSATALALAANNLTLSTGYIQFSGAGYVDLGASGYLIAGTAGDATGKVRLANNTWVSAENQAGNGNVNIISINTSDLVAFGANVAATTFAGTVTIGAQQISGSTGNLTFSGAGYVSIGANPADAGYLRLSNNVAVAWRNAANGDNVTLTVNASDIAVFSGAVTVGGALQLGGNTLSGATGSAGDLTLQSTSHATKGCVTIADGEQGLKIGGVTEHGTPGTNVLSIFNGTAPVGAHAGNAASFYTDLVAATYEMFVMDSGGTATQISPHDSEGFFYLNSYDARRDFTVRIHVERMLRDLAAVDPDRLGKYIEEFQGNALTKV